jgi:Tol biopolymer transport system component
VLATEEGRLLGTPTYMAPEQARGKPIDKRVDVWAFGCVLFECLTGRRAFEGETISDVLASVLEKEPDWTALPAAMSMHTRELLLRCLDKDPRSRLRDVGEARVRLGAPLPTLSNSADSGARGVPIRLAVGGVVVAALVAAVATWGLRPGDDVSARAPLRKIEFEASVEPLQEAVLSPDGQHVAVRAGGRLWVRNLQELQARELPDTDHARFVFWSPDGTEIGYLQGRRLWRSNIAGTERRRIADFPERWVSGAGAHWTEDGRIVFARGNTHLYEVPASGGDVRVLLESPNIDAEHFHDPFVLPGSRGIVFATHGHSGVDRLELIVEGERKVLLHLEGETVDNPRYSPTGHLIFSRGPEVAGIWAMPFSLDRLEGTGSLFLVSPGGTHPSLASDGTLLYRGGRNSGRRGLAWADREGNVVGEIGEFQRDPRTPRLSPDGRWVAVSAYEGGQRNLWLHDVERGTKRQLTSGAEADTDPAWQDERYLLFTRSGENGTFACRIAIDGSTEVEVLPGLRGGEGTRDGRIRVYHDRGGIWIVEDGGEPRPFHSAPDDSDRWPMISPQEDFISFGAGTTTLGSVFLKRFPSGEGQWQVSSEGGNWTRWGPDGDELFFTNEGILYAMTVDVGDEVSFDAPRKLFGELEAGLICGLGYDIDLEGERILCLVPEEVEQPTMTLVQSWYSEFAMSGGEEAE